MYIIFDKLMNAYVSFFMLLFMLLMAYLFSFAVGSFGPPYMSSLQEACEGLCQTPGLTLLLCGDCGVQAGTYLPQSYLVHEEMIVTERLEHVDQLGNFIYNLCRGKDTYKLQRRDRFLGTQQQSFTRRTPPTPTSPRSNSLCSSYRYAEA